MRQRLLEQQFLGQKAREALVQLQQMLSQQQMVMHQQQKHECSQQQ